MNQILEYIMVNYTWFLVGLIIILLAIIGRYADKTNFGQGNNKIDEDKNNEDQPIINSNLKLQDALGMTKKDNDVKETIHTSENSEKLSTQNVSTNNSNSLDNNLNNNENSIDNKGNRIEFEKFEDEFNSILPKKSIIDDELLDDINNLSLENTKKIEINDIPDLDDVELPKIKPIDKKNTTIWK